MTFNPPHPKHKAIRLHGKAYAELKRKVWIRDGGRCVTCNAKVPLKDWDGQFDRFTCAHLSHIKSRGAGGDDTPENTQIKCYSCHIGKEHGPRWNKRLIKSEHSLSIRVYRNAINFTDE